MSNAFAGTATRRRVASLPATAMRGRLAREIQQSRRESRRCCSRARAGRPHRAAPVCEMDGAPTGCSRPLRISGVPAWGPRLVPNARPGARLVTRPAWRLSRTRTKYEPVPRADSNRGGTNPNPCVSRGQRALCDIGAGSWRQTVRPARRAAPETQWEDGGWNCDRAPSVSHSSFEETLLPLRGLIRHAHERSGRASASAARRAAELLLERRLFKRRSTGRMIARDFIELHYPCYWHYDVLFALKVLAEGRFIHDERCDEAVALVRSKSVLMADSQPRQSSGPAEPAKAGGRS